MKKVPKTVCCSRCGDEIAPEELVYCLDHLCALCSNMRLEAQEIARMQHQRRNSYPPIHSVPINQQ